MDGDEIASPGMTVTRPNLLNIQASVVLFARDYGIPGMIPGMTVIRPNLLSPNFCSGLYFQYSKKNTQNLGPRMNGEALNPAFVEPFGSSGRDV